MQKITIKTPVETPYQEVVSRFDERLFEALAPRFPQMELLRHDPIAEGAEVHLLLHLGWMKQKWVSVLSQVVAKEDEFSFQDRGVELPFPLLKWHHLHQVFSRAGGKAAEIIDEIYFTTGWKLLDWLAKPILFALFSQRKAKYVAYFKQRRP